MDTASHAAPLVRKNLADMTEAGLLRKTDLGDHLYRYEPASASTVDHGHPHFLCTACGDVACLPDLGLALPAGVPRSMALGAVEIQFKGTCDACLP